MEHTLTLKDDFGRVHTLVFTAVAGGSIKMTYYKNYTQKSSFVNTLENARRRWDEYTGQGWKATSTNEKEII